jgi:hypothetical protein
LQALLVGGAAFGSNCFQPCSNAGKTRDHVAEVIAGDAYQLNMVERRTCGGTNSAAKQADLAEVIAARKIGKNQLTSGVILRNAHKADSN